MYGVCGLKSWVLLSNMGCLTCFVGDGGDGGDGSDGGDGGDGGLK